MSLFPISFYWIALPLALKVEISAKFQEICCWMERVLTIFYWFIDFDFESWKSCKVQLYAILEYKNFYNFLLIVISEVRFLIKFHWLWIESCNSCKTPSIPLLNVSSLITFYWWHYQNIELLSNSRFNYWKFEFCNIALTISTYFRVFMTFYWIYC